MLGQKHHELNINIGQEVRHDWPIKGKSNKENGAEVATRTSFKRINMKEENKGANS